MNAVFSCAFLIAVTLCGSTAHATTDGKTPIGLWVTVDDKTGARRSQVRIDETKGVLTGRIEQILEADKRNANCIKCTGPRRNQPVLGMTIIEGVRLNGGEGYWEYGSILDPNDGKVYRVRLTPKNGGRMLEVRGFLGPFYRNQYWIRAE
ncbi:MAG: DUF2147 domain-containing protein [Gammaproteobacteria bacterium]|jgi:uncharacterized protein (DUF2147 family)|nr:DUF2147 domain-containing protein [Gammaproteobacteria bacterium]NDB16753.1 DUF2147 domain-containing protein [Gammaproteobacteria bacterium]